MRAALQDERLRDERALASPDVTHLVILGSMASILEAPVAAGAFALLSLPGMLCLSGSLVLSCYLVCFLIFTLVAANSRVSKLAEGVKRRHKPQGPEQPAMAVEWTRRKRESDLIR